MRRTSLPAAISLATSLLFVAYPSLGDNLVLTDGSTIETKGAWEVRGSVIVFHLPNGSLSSLRASKVDLDASAQLTVQTEQASEVVPEPEEPQAVVLTLTDSDIGHVNPESLPDWQLGIEPEGEDTTDDTLFEDVMLEDSMANDAINDPDDSEDTDSLDEIDSEDEPYFDEEAEGEEPTTASAASQSSTAPLADVERLQVTSWQESTVANEIGGTRIVGTLMNSSQEIASQIEVTVKLFDSTNSLLATAEAAVTAGALRPQQSTTFSADVIGVTNYDNVQFETEHVALTWRQAPANPS